MEEASRNKPAAIAEMPQGREEKSTCHKDSWHETRMGVKGERRWQGWRGRGKQRDPAQKCQDWGPFSAPGSPVDITGGWQLHIAVSSIPNEPCIHGALSILAGLSFSPGPHPLTSGPTTQPANHSSLPLSLPQTFLQIAFSEWVFSVETSATSLRAG